MIRVLIAEDSPHIRDGLSRLLAGEPDMELVGINFDRNINGLSRDFIYLPEQGRNVMVDVRAIRAALEHVYGADRILEELGVVVGN